MSDHTSSYQLETLRGIDTPALSDAMDRLGIPCQLAGIMPLDRSFAFAGRAFTVLYREARPGENVGDFLDDIEPDQACVIDNQGRMDATVWGDLMTTVAKRKAIAATVIDGVCRDLDRALDFDYPLFTRGNWMRTGKDRVTVEAVNVPVTIGGITVRPDDYLRGDMNGVVLIPADRVDEVIGVAQEIEDAEAAIRAEILAGANLREARERAGYHKLQTRTD